MLTPCYLLDLKKVSNNFVNFKESAKIAFKEYGGLGIGYSIKTNDDKRILFEGEKRGYYAEVTSLFEIRLALKLKFQKIIFNGPAKTDSELYYAIKNGIEWISCESLEEIVKINKIAKRFKKTQNIFLRIDTRIFQHPSNRLILFLFKKTTYKKSKFGFDYRNIKKYYNKIADLDYVNVEGINVHLGSQINYPELYIEAVNRIPRTILKKIKIIDLGGGYPSSTPERRNKFFNLLLSKFRKEITSKQYLKKISLGLMHLKNKTIFLEPGRIIVSDCMDAVFSVIRKQNNKVYLDGGINVIPFHLFPRQYKILRIPCNILDKDLIKYIHSYPIIRNSKNMRRYTLFGNFCFEGDIIAKDVILPKVNIGDKIIFKEVGAYTLSLKFKFTQSKPKIYLI